MMREIKEFFKYFCEAYDEVADNVELYNQMI